MNMLEYKSIVFKAIFSVIHVGEKRSYLTKSERNLWFKLFE